ncbi:DUF4263 domain-containing protein [Sphingopyxis sp. YF1]|uniref:Shedu anti-phage system protein SduA domain-containing protein n=1 Tax=Sphingopyxis sp. YF1 TaxID=2482763 RepID=UPI001F61C826|nr:Shedu anti-phage system protein SduA domain-containing protein [Sphingopyxis sp. YF1]UNU44497.1 DUF4263 domain-containing protein [Sphingopyxis sp. YF1]
MALDAAEFAAFEALVRGNARRELECRPYLEHAENLLIRQTLLSTVRFIEVRSFAGDADLVVAADVLTDTGDVERVAYFWELKAPQCFLFEYDENKNRCRPTPDFVKAENQLLHYLDEAVGSDSARTRFGVMDRKNIRPGGIIIGSKDRILRSPARASDVELAQSALKMRTDRLYYSQGIRVLHWDRVLDWVRPTNII